MTIERGRKPFEGCPFRGCIRHRSGVRMHRCLEVNGSHLGKSNLLTYGFRKKIRGTSNNSLEDNVTTVLQQMFKLYILEIDLLDSSSSMKL